jgi:2'-5' RNA ligase
MMKPRNPTEEHLPTTPPPNDTRPGPESLHTKSPQSIYEELGDIGFTNMMKRTKLVQDKGSGWPDLFGPIKREKNKAGGIIRLASTETNSAKTITFQEAEKGYKFFHVISNRHPLARDGQPPKRIVFKPRVPKGYVYEDDFGEAIEDTTTRRVSLAKTIKGCLSGSLYESYNDEDWYVYGTKQSISVVDLSKVKCPIENYGEDFVWEKSQYKDLSRRDRTKLLVNCVPDMKKSGELWSLASVEMQYIGKVTGIRTQKIVPASTEINAVSDNSTMVALWAPADLMSPLKPIVKQFKNPVDVKDLHVTLVYIGDTTRDEVGLVENHVRELCDATGLLTAKVGGIGYFEPSESSDGKYPIYLSISCPGLDLLRADLWRALEKEGIKLPEDWGFSPHLTIAYATKEEKDKLTKLDLSDVLGKSWQVTSLAVCHGQARKYVKLGERGKVPIVGAK